MTEPRDVRKPSQSTLRQHAHRLLARHERGCWLAALVEAIPAQADDDSVGRWAQPAHWLVAGWAPDPARPPLYPRFPEFAAIASPDSQRAIAELFVHLPADVRVLMVGSEHVDFALVAGMVLAVDRNLEDWQRAALEVFVAARRERDRAQIVRRYTDREPDFERFRSRALGNRRGAGPDDPSQGAGSGEAGA